MRGPETGDIIKFYNQIFVPAFKQYLVQSGENIPAAVPTNIRPKDEDRNEKGGKIWMVHVCVKRCSRLDAHEDRGSVQTHIWDFILLYVDLNPFCDLGFLVMFDSCFTARGTFLLTIIIGLNVFMV